MASSGTHSDAQRIRRTRHWNGLQRQANDCVSWLSLAVLVRPLLFYGEQTELESPVLPPQSDNLRDDQMTQSTEPKAIGPLGKVAAIERVPIVVLHSSEAQRCQPR